MAKYDNPEHSVSLYSTTPAKDAGGGEVYTFALAQASVPCLINTASASTVELFAQQGVRVTHTVSILSSVLTATPLTSWKAIAADTGTTLMLRGIRSGRAVGSVPAFTYLDCEEVR